MTPEESNRISRAYCIIIEKPYINRSLYKWYEYSNTNFVGIEDSRPIFPQDNQLSYNNIPALRLTREMHDLLSPITEYDIHIFTDYANDEYYIKCTFDNITKDAELILKLSYNITVHKTNNS